MLKTTIISSIKNLDRKVIRLLQPAKNRASKSAFNEMPAINIEKNMPRKDALRIINIYDVVNGFRITQNVKNNDQNIRRMALRAYLYFRTMHRSLIRRTVFAGRTSNDKK